uniref:ATP synthase complex subunit 8 n=1 Tax=Megalagrion pacificum TaxID=218359 RepID=Q85AH4_9ODON|nr:ATP synthase F0 subunit 8 [Megalagrion pacificum]AAO34333.1 ATP synthase F0 subunit 8 [Megalagrion pacificum]
MPQMAPMSWLMLFVFFTMSLLFILTMNYYLYIPTMETELQKEEQKSKMMNWK